MVYSISHTPTWPHHPVHISSPSSQPIQSDSSQIPSGELTFCYGKSPFLMGKSTISIAIFHGKMLVHQRIKQIDKQADLTIRPTTVTTHKSFLRETPCDVHLPRSRTPKNLGGPNENDSFDHHNCHPAISQYNRIIGASISQTYPNSYTLCSSSLLPSVRFLNSIGDPIKLCPNVVLIPNNSKNQKIFIIFSTLCMAIHIQNLAGSLDKWEGRYMPSSDFTE